MSYVGGGPSGAYAKQRAHWLARLAVEPTLPERTVIVRTEAAAHCWRRDLIAAGRADLLRGTRFVTAFGAALEVLGAPVELGEEAARAARIAALLGEELGLEALDPAVLTSRPGWDEALAKTIGELEAAGLTPPALAGAADPRARDVARIWVRLDALASASWTSARVYRESAQMLEADRTRWPYRGPILVEVTGHETAVQARWLRSLPSVTFASLSLRPHRSDHVRRMHRHFPNLVTTEPSEITTERDLLSRFVFSDPERLSDPARPRSQGVDGTVHFEQHSGIEEELDAAVAWVIAEVGEHQTPLEQLAIVVPRLDPYAALLAPRLDVLGPDGVHVVGGLPALSTASGARIAAVLRTLRGFLHLHAMADLIPTLKLGGDAQISRRDAVALLYELGTAGGHRGHHAGARDWAARRARRVVTAAAELDACTDNDADARRASLERLIAQLTALEAPFAALDDAARALVEEAPIDALWTAIRALCAQHVRLGSDGQRILAAADDALAPLRTANLLRGTTALDAITKTIESLRLPTGRFGEPRVTIVALRDALGLSFRCTRVLGLIEGVIPTSTREDPVLPDAVRVALDDAVPTSSQRALAQLHALHHVIEATAARLVLSSARMDVDGQYREPSGVLTEAAAALGRASTEIPDTRALRLRYFEPASACLAEVRGRWPVDERARLARAARTRAVPAEWRTSTLLPLTRWVEPAEPHAMDGWFEPGPFADVPGLEPELPISASALSRLLDCPHRFLYERILGWQPPPELVEDGTVDALAYGSLFHETAEAFFREHGPAFTSHQRSLDAWKPIGTAIADERFAAFVERYPLVGPEIRTAQRNRLLRDLAVLLERDWATPKQFVDVERAFGPTRLELEGQTVYVRGYIDRLDRVGAATLVRDLKTGRSKPREKEPWLPAYDVQLGLYGLVVQAHASEWKLPATVRGAYVYPADSSGEDRSFEDDFPALAAATGHWIATGVQLLRDRRFPRTPDADDCRFCSFQPVCGTNANERAQALLDSGELAAFATLKLGEDEDD